MKDALYRTPSGALILVEFSTRVGIDGGEHVVTYVTPYARSDGSLIVGAPTRAVSLDLSTLERLV